MQRSQRDALHRQRLAMDLVELSDQSSLSSESDSEEAVRSASKKHSWVYKDTPGVGFEAKRVESRTSSERRKRNEDL